MISNERSEARSVILRLRRYRDRIEEITRGDDGGVAASAPAGVAAQLTPPPSWGQRQQVPLADLPLA
jgi:hypothetical protein